MATETTASRREKEADRGILVPLKTCKELASRDKVIDVWVIGLENIKNASHILSGHEFAAKKITDTHTLTVLRENNKIKELIGREFTSK